MPAHSLPAMKSRSSRKLLLISASSCSIFVHVLACPLAQFDYELAHATLDKLAQHVRPLTAKRMETVDEEFLAATLDAMDRARAPTDPSSSGTTQPGCTSGRTFRRNIKTWSRRKDSRRRHGRGRRPRRRSAQKSLMTLTSPTIRLSFSPPTTALRRLAGRTAA
jgi:hypothetical protein